MDEATTASTGGQERCEAEPADGGTWPADALTLVRRASTTIAALRAENRALRMLLARERRETDCALAKVVWAAGILAHEMGTPTRVRASSADDQHGDR
jgi:hypothetical protein